MRSPLHAANVGKCLGSLAAGREHPALPESPMPQVNAIFNRPLPVDAPAPNASLTVIGGEEAPPYHPAHWSSPRRGAILARTRDNYAAVLEAR